ncbi:hypothetical protein CRG98_002889, partial [Punica granatum]
MEMSSSLLSTPTIVITTIIALAVSLYYISGLRNIRSGQTGRGKKMVPSAGGSWPLIGHLHLLGGSIPPHIVLAEMADNYGAMFAVKLGIRQTVVVSTWEMAKECLTTNDRALATRPRSLSSEVMGYNGAFVGLSPYGPYWSQIRKIITRELLSSHQLELLRQVCESEVLGWMKDMYKECTSTERDIIGLTRTTVRTTKVDMKRRFGDLALNMMLRIIVGTEYTKADGGVNDGMKFLIRDFIELAGRFVASDALPFLSWLDLGGYQAAMKRTSRGIDRLLQEWLDEHKSRRKPKGEDGAMNPIIINRGQDFMDVMLPILEDDQDIQSYYDADTINKATCL